jgi:hypothetical protein
MSGTDATERSYERDDIVAALRKRGRETRDCTYMPSGPSRGWHIWHGPERGRDGAGGMFYAADTTEALRTIELLPFARRSKEDKR